MIENGSSTVLGVQSDRSILSVGDLADIFIDLFNKVGLAAAAIHTYKATILSALETRQSFTMSQLSMLNKL